MILEIKFDGLMLSNGPGDPADNVQIIEELKKIYASDMVHQLMALATGATTEKLKYGHRGANHPVRDIDVVKAESVNPEIATVSHINVNDGTVEGLKYYRDTGYLFDRFIEKMEAKKHAEE